MNINIFETIDENISNDDFNKLSNPVLREFVLNKLLHISESRDTRLINFTTVSWNEIDDVHKHLILALNIGQFGHLDMAYSCYYQNIRNFLNILFIFIPQMPQTKKKFYLLFQRFLFVESHYYQAVISKLCYNIYTARY
jgi:hypothetical protein